MFLCTMGHTLNIDFCLATFVIHSVGYEMGLRLQDLQIMYSDMLTWKICIHFSFYNTVYFTSHSTCLYCLK